MMIVLGAACLPQISGHAGGLVEKLGAAFYALYLLHWIMFMFMFIFVHGMPQNRTSRSGRRDPFSGMPDHRGTDNQPLRPRPV
jgi:peptidoglycan/LPS O-acetylase OafA/YrhL